MKIYQNLHLMDFIYSCSRILGITFCYILSKTIKKIYCPDENVPPMDRSQNTIIWCIYPIVMFLVSIFFMRVINYSSRKFNGFASLSKLLNFFHWIFNVEHYKCMKSKISPIEQSEYREFFSVSYFTVQRCRQSLFNKFVYKSRNGRP
jgi:hypothetical protein